MVDCAAENGLVEPKLLHQDLTREIIAAAIEVHRELGPGLLESAYHFCMCRELTLRSIPYVTEVALPVDYKGSHLECGYRMDLVVDGRVAVELKAVEKVLPNTSSATFDLSPAGPLTSRAAD